MKTIDHIILYASTIVGLFSLLILGGEKAPEVSDASYWTFKGVALLFFGISFMGIKSIEDKFPDDKED